MKKSNLLVITPVKNIKSIYKDMLKNFNVFYYPELEKNPKKINTKKIDFIYTNPNKSKIYIGKSFLDLFPNLKCICTASTGTTHIDKKYLQKKNIKLISLTKEIRILKKISSTSELAVGLSLMAIRNIYNAIGSVKNGKWDYEKFIGRQLNNLTIGIVGFGRLGKIYYRLMKNFGPKFIIYDPFIKIKKTNKLSKVNSLSNLFTKCDIVSLHVHVNEKTTKMINYNILKNANKNIIIINTSRGELIDEDNMISFLRKNKNSKLYVDVLTNEVNKKFKSKIYRYFKRKNNKQIVITPHIGGMTKEAQEMAYGRALDLLIKYGKNL